MHIEASEAAFAAWMTSLGIPEVMAHEDPGTRQWMDPTTDRCFRALVVFPSESYGVLGITCH